MKTFISIDGQSIYDVCLNTYGSLDYLGKIMIDNGIDGVNQCLTRGMVFFYDENLVVNQGVLQSFADAGIYFATQVECKENGSANGIYSEVYNSVYA